VVTRYGEPHVVVMPAERYWALITRAKLLAGLGDRPSGEDQTKAPASMSELGGDPPNPRKNFTRSVTVHGNLIDPTGEEWDAERDASEISRRTLEMADQSMENFERGLVGEAMSTDALRHITLSDRDRDRILQLLEDPPEPNDALRKALAILAQYVDPSMANPIAFLTTEDIEGLDELLEGVVYDKDEPLDGEFQLPDDSTDGEGG